MVTRKARGLAADFSPRQTTHTVPWARWDTGRKFNCADCHSTRASQCQSMEWGSGTEAWVATEGAPSMRVRSPALRVGITVWRYRRHRPEERRLQTGGRAAAERRERENQEATPGPAHPPGQPTPFPRTGPQFGQAWASQGNLDNGAGRQAAMAASKSHAQLACHIWPQPGHPRACWSCGWAGRLAGRWRGRGDKQRRASSAF